METAAHPEQPDADPGTQRSWGDVSAALLSAVVDETPPQVSPDHVVLVNRGRPYRMEELLDGRVFHTHGSIGHVAVIPAGVPVAFRTRAAAPQRVEAVAVRIAPAFLSQVAGRLEVDRDPVELVGTLGSRSPAVQRAAMSFVPELQQEQLLGDLYADSLAQLLAVTLLRTHSSLGTRDQRAVGAPVGALTRTALRTVVDYVEDPLASDLALEQLSGVVHGSDGSGRRSRWPGPPPAGTSAVRWGSPRAPTVSARAEARLSKNLPAERRNVQEPRADVGRHCCGRLVSTPREVPP